MVADLSDKSLATSKRIEPSVITTKDHSELLASDEVDAVVISSSAETHFPIAMEALAHNKDVLVEKPFVLTIKEGEELVALAESKGRILMVGHLLKYHPAVTRLKELVTSGALGRVFYICSKRVNLGVVRANENALWSLAPHDISVMLYLLDRDPVMVSATGQSYIQKGIEDVVFFTLYFSSGEMCNGHVSWLDPHKIREFIVVGSKKMVVFDDMEATEKVKIYDKGVEGAAESYASYGEAIAIRMGDINVPWIRMVEPLRTEALHFLECVKERKTPLTDGKDGMKVLRVLEAAQHSLRNGGTPVKLEPH